MISVTRPGGSGFFSLTYQGQRMAYLREDPNEQIVITNKTAIPGPSKFIFYEIEPAMWGLLASNGTSLELMKGLQDAINRGQMWLTRVIKNPMGTITNTSYSLKGCSIQEMVEEYKTVVGGGVKISQRIWFDPPPQLGGSFISQAPPTPQEAKKIEPEVQPLDVSAPIYALRSFTLGEGRLRSLYRDFWWDEGKAIAQCSKDHEIPASGCQCGLYGLQSLDRLVREYGKDCQHCVAVFAAEGRTIVGDRGLKTKAARVIAYWVRSKTELDVMAKEAPKAKHYEDIAKMLEDYHFPAWGTVEVVGPMGSSAQWDPPSPEATAERWRYSPLPWKPEPKPEPDLRFVNRARTGKTSSSTVVVGNFKFSEIKKAMGPAATPGGLDAVQHVHDLMTGKKKT